MAIGKWFLCATVVMAGTAVFSIADEPTAAPTTQPTDAKPAKAKKLTEPWSYLKDLTPDQTAQIEKIHSDAGEEIKKISTKETSDITALLTPDQIIELKQAEAKHRAEEKEKAAHHKKDTATTEPSK